MAFLAIRGYDGPPVATTRAGEPNIDTCFPLSQEHRRRLLKGDYRPIVLETKPYGCEPGATYVLTWSRQQRSAVGDVVIAIPRTPSCWLAVTKIVRHRAGGWLIRYDVTDHREAIRFLRRTPPVMDPHSSGTGTAESAYTTSRWAAIDELEVVPDQWQGRISKLASERDHKIREGQAAERNRDAWRRKRKRKISMRVELAA